jgi:hypothetical protein
MLLRRFKVMAPQVKPGLTKSNVARGHQESETLITISLFFPRAWLTKGKRNVIERRTQIIGSIAKQKIEFLGNRINARKAHAAYMLAVCLEPKTIEVRFDKSAGECIHSVEMFLRPRNFRSSRVQTGHAETSPIFGWFSFNEHYHKSTACP